MIVSSAGNHVIALFHKEGGQGLRIGDYLLLVINETRLERLVERHGLRRNAVLERTTLSAREYSGIENLGHFLYNTLRRLESPRVIEVLAHKDDAAARSAQGLVSGGSHYVGIFHGVLEQTGRNHSGSMGHIHHKNGTHLVGNLPHPGVIPLAGVGGSSSDDELRLVLQSEPLHLIVIYQAGVLVQSVSHRLEQHSGHIHRRAVGKMAAVTQVESHKAVTRFQAGELHGHIGLRSRMRLHICILRSVNLLEAVDCELLDLVHNLTTSIISCSGITLGILVCANRAKCLKHLVTDIIL